MIVARPPVALIEVVLVEFVRAGMAEPCYKPAHLFQLPFMKRVVLVDQEKSRDSQVSLSLRVIGYTRSMLRDDVFDGVRPDVAGGK